MVKKRKSWKKKQRQNKKNTPHQRLVDIGAKFLRDTTGKRWSCTAVFTEIMTANNEIPDVMGFFSGGSTLIEAKTSRVDFLRDKQKPFRKYPAKGLGKYRFYICPEGLIKKKEISHYWGLLYVDDNGVVKVISTPKPYKNYNIEGEHMYLYSIIRRNLKRIK